MKDNCTSETVFVVQCKLDSHDEKWHDCRTFKTIAALDKSLALKRFNVPGFIYRVMVRIVFNYDLCYLQDGYEWEGGAE